jgi:hypothetical protein
LTGATPSSVVRRAALIEVERVVVLQVVVPASAHADLSAVYSEAVFDLVSSSAFASVLPRGVDAVAAWRLHVASRLASLLLRFSRPRAFTVALDFDLLDTDWRRLLVRLHERSSAGTEVALFVHASETEMERAGRALADGDEGVWGSTGVGVELRLDCRALARVGAVEPALTPEERAAAPVRTEPAVHEWRQRPMVVEIDPARGGAAAAEFDGGVGVLVDLGYDDPDGSWARAALKALCRHGLTSTQLEGDLPELSGWHYLLYPEHVVILAGDRKDGRPLAPQQRKVLYAGPLRRTAEWNERAEYGRAALPRRQLRAAQLAGAPLRAVVRAGGRSPRAGRRRCHDRRLDLRPAAVPQWRQSSMKARTWSA